MTRWLIKLLGIRNHVTAAALALAIFGMVGIGASFTIEYVVNTYRSTDHWVKYFHVDPVFDTVEVGCRPPFKSTAVWFVETDAAWFDRMWCTADSGVLAAMTIRIDSPGFGQRELSRPRTVGVVDETGEVLEGGKEGYWTWGGKIPRVESQCTLEPRLKIYPSPLVVRDVPMPESAEFKFRHKGAAECQW